MGEGGGTAVQEKTYPKKADSGERGWDAAARKTQVILHFTCIQRKRNYLLLARVVYNSS